MSLQLRNSFLLLLTAFIWGTAFVAQSVGNELVGPLTFTASRSLLGALALFVLAALFDHFRPHESRSGAFLTRWCDKKLWLTGIGCGFFLVSGTLLQQFGLLWTTVGKAGFITSLYIIIVPIVGFFLGRKPTRLTLIAVPVAVTGLYFLCFKSTSWRLDFGDILVFLGAFAFSGHILFIDRYAGSLDAVRMSCIQFLFCFVTSGIGAAAFEGIFALEHIQEALFPIFYAGVLSSAVAYTLQIIGQRGVNPTVASLVMSLESVISVLAGWVLLNQVLTGREVFGCVLMAVAIVLAQLPDRFGRLRR
ncbi:MAG TPA: EamA family transporter [Sutterella sp.]|nr:EamA family transporter [Sutterella sp.]